MKQSSPSAVTVDRPATAPRRIRIPGAIIGPMVTKVETGPVLVREVAGVD